MQQQGKISMDQFHQGVAAMASTVHKTAKPVSAPDSSRQHDSTSLQSVKSLVFEGARPWLRDRLPQEERRLVNEVLQHAQSDDMYEALRFLRAYGPQLGTT